VPDRLRLRTLKRLLHQRHHDRRSRADVADRPRRRRAHLLPVALQTLDERLDGLLHERLVARAELGQGPHADDFDHRIAALGVLAELGLGFLGDLADADQGVRGRGLQQGIFQGLDESRCCRRRALAHRGQRENRLLAHVRRRMIEQFDQTRDCRLGLGAELAEHQAGPVGRLLVGQRLHQARHRFFAVLGNGLHGPHLDRRIRVFQQLDQQRQGHLRTGSNGRNRPRGLPANRRLRIANQADQRFHRPPGRLADLAQGPRRVGPHGRRVAGKRLGQSFDRLGALRTQRAQRIDRLQTRRLLVRRQGLDEAPDVFFRCPHGRRRQQDGRQYACNHPVSHVCLRDDRIWAVHVTMAVLQDKVPCLSPLPCVEL